MTFIFEQTMSHAKTTFYRGLRPVRLEIKFKLHSELFSGRNIRIKPWKRRFFFIGIFWRQQDLESMIQLRDCRHHESTASNAVPMTSTDGDDA